MTDDAKVTMGTLRRERWNRALETVENMLSAFQIDGETLVIVVCTHFAAGHNTILLFATRALMQRKKQRFMAPDHGDHHLQQFIGRTYIHLGIDFGESAIGVFVGRHFIKVAFFHISD